MAHKVKWIDSVISGWHRADAETHATREMSEDTLAMLPTWLEEVDF